MAAIASALRLGQRATIRGRRFLNLHEYQSAQILAAGGVTVPRGDAAALAAALRGLLRDPARRQALGIAGRRRIVDNFSWSVCAGAMVAYYRRVLARADR